MAEALFPGRRLPAIGFAFRRGGRVSRPGKKLSPLCPLCLCGESSIKPSHKAKMLRKVDNRSRN